MTRSGPSAKGERETKVPVSNFRCNNAEVLREVALAGGEICLLPDWLADDDIEASGWRAVR